MLGVFATALFYGDSMITPAVTVLSAVEGLTTVQQGFAPFVVPAAIVHPRRPVRNPVAGHGAGRRDVRTRDAGLFHRAGGARRDPHHGPTECHPGDDQPVERGRFLHRRIPARLSRDGLGRPRAHRRRSALCRHGPFRPPPDQGRVALFRASRTAAQLYGAGRDAPFTAGRAEVATEVKDPFFYLASDSLPPAARDHRDFRVHHRQPGGHFRRLLGHPAGDPAWLRPATADSPHQRKRGRPDLHPGRQLGTDDDGPHSRADLPLLLEPGRGLWNRGHRRDGDRYAC